MTWHVTKNSNQQKSFIKTNSKKSAATYESHQSSIHPSYPPSHPNRGSMPCPAAVPAARVAPMATAATPRGAVPHHGAAVRGDGGPPRLRRSLRGMAKEWWNMDM